MASDIWFRDLESGDYRNNVIDDDLPLDLSGPRVLLIEDDPMVIRELRSLIHKNLKYATVKDFDSSEDALSFLKSSYDLPHLIVVDIHLKGNNGLEFSKKLIHEYKDIPFMFLTGMPQEEFFKMAKNYSALPPYLEKPLEQEDFKKLLKNYFPKTDLRF